MHTLVLGAGPYSTSTRDRQTNGQTKSHYIACHMSYNLAVKTLVVFSQSVNQFIRNAADNSGELRTIERGKINGIHTQIYHNI